MPLSPDEDKYKVYSRRTLLLAGGQACLLATLAGRMYYLQVVESDQYQMLAEDNRISIRLLAPQRGKILDRFGFALADNRPDYRVLLVPEQTRSVHDTMNSLGHIITLTDGDIERVMKSTKTQRAFLPIEVRDNLSWDDFARINVESPDLPGIQPDVGSTRHYPFGPKAAHLVGYVGAVSEAEMTDDALMQLPGFKIGKSGVERVMDEELRGSAGNSKVEVNALGRVIRELSRDDGTPGQDIRLSVDAAIQQFAAKRLRNESASTVVMNIHSGEVIALVSMPAYDPNQFNIGISTRQWDRLVHDKRKPLIDKSVSGLYPPGSTFKLIVAMAAIESGLITSDHTVFCGGKIHFGNRYFHCWKSQGHGKLDMVEAIQHSCDIYFYDIANKIGVDAIAKMANRFGLGDIFDIPLPGEARGTIPTVAWKRARFGQPWHPGETLSVGIGQGYVTTTPLQLAVMVSRIANGGKTVMPRFLMSETNNTNPALPEFPALGISDQALGVVHAGMNAVTNSIHGTAFRARIHDKDYAMAGKTGTSQVRRISKEERDSGVIKNKDRPWEERDHALFVAYGPVDNPKYAISVVVEHGGGGSTTAAPIARDILYETMKRDPCNTVRTPDDIKLKEV